MAQLLMRPSSFMRSRRVAVPIRRMKTGVELGGSLHDGQSFYMPEGQGGGCGAEHRNDEWMNKGGGVGLSVGTGRGMVANTSISNDRKYNEECLLKILRPFSFSLLLGLIVLVIPNFVSAQSNTATIVGQTTDSTKAVIIGADVVVINTATNVRYESKTNNAGSFLVPPLPPGPYRVEIEKQNRRSGERSGSTMKFPIGKRQCCGRSIRCRRRWKCRKVSD
jgi:hypothetical protein